ncbi:hypothetical protein PN36_32865 [Candidatus Thiomargarita nelsonii]|uniref:Uncharacterized protein n=1 Tax=Candidatus Thiomargarita nelsonii TaxID=1003181 RepID=A0A4E0RMK2_9GAMM|nr:hypothetical protein PN36_32865 [Candidatus Thiomargarita nelsonii]
MPNLTISIEDSIFNAAQVYVKQRGTTISQITRAYLAQLTDVKQSEDIEPLVQFSHGKINRFQAMKALDIDYFTLLDRLGQQKLSLLTLPSEKLEPMVDSFVRIMKEAPEL